MISATPGSTVAFTMTLPMPARDVVRWSVVDPLNRVVAEGSQPATGVLVAITFVLPSGSAPSLDGTPYVVSASDGATSTSDALRVVSSIDPSCQHDGEYAYSKGRPFRDVLISDVPLANVVATIALHDGTVLANGISASDVGRIGEAHAYAVDAGVLDTRTSTTYGMGTIVWDFDRADGLPAEGAPEYHAFWTITPYVATIIAAIRKIVDRARAGDANAYLEIKASDLANAVIRGVEVVSESAPMLTPFALDQIPIALRDYVVKAGAADLLRAQYLAEGMSAFDLSGEGVQLQVDRSQYIDALAQQLMSDVQSGLPAAKKAWQQQGSPLGGGIVNGVRPIGILALTTGTYSNYRMPSLVNPFFGLSGGGYSFARIQQQNILQLVGTLSPSPGDGVQQVVGSVPD